MNYLERLKILLAGLLMGSLLALGANVMADGDPTTDQVARTLPYQGTLEVDGQPLQATGEQALPMEFQLYASQADEHPVYRQQIIVEVFSGRFTTIIGPLGLDAEGNEVEVSQVIQAADDLHLGMVVLGDLEDPEDDIVLAGRQRIHATPYALWTTSATDMSIARNLVIGGDAQVGGGLNVEGNSRLVGGVEVVGDVNLPNGSLGLSNMENAFVGTGLQSNQEALRVDESWLDGRIRGWVREHCQVRLGYRDACSNCSSGPSKQVTVQANGTCIAASGSDTRCRGGNAWGGVNTDGDVDGNDVFYIYMNCD